MPSLADSAVIFILALMLVGPKNLPKLARQLGKLMAEFRRASNEFRMQMEDELRVEEQKEHEAKVAALTGPSDPVADFGKTPEPEQTEQAEAPAGEAVPIAEAGSLKMMPPSTGLPVQAGAYPTPDLAPEANAATVPHDAGSSSEEPREELFENAPHPAAHDTIHETLA